MRVFLVVTILLTSYLSLFQEPYQSQIEDADETLYSTYSRSTDDTDGDGIMNWDDSCPEGVSHWIPTNTTDHDEDGCKDRASEWGSAISQPSWASAEEEIYDNGYIYHFDYLRLAKFDMQGNAVWDLSFPFLGNGYGLGRYAFDQTSNIFLVGGFGNSEVSFDDDVLNGSANYGADTLIVKVSNSGEYLWARTIGAGEIYHVAVDSTGNAYVCGHRQSHVGLGWDGSVEYGLVAKFSANGQLIWENGFDDYGIMCNDLTVDDLGNVYVVGQFQWEGVFGDHTISDDYNHGEAPPGAPGTCTYSYTCYDAFVAKLSANGQWMWARGMGSNEDDAATVVEVIENGEVIVGGRASYEVTFGEHNVWMEPHWAESSRGGFLAKIDEYGNWLAAEGYHWTFINDIEYIGGNSLLVAGFYYYAGTLGPHLTNWTALGSFNGYVGEYDVGLMNYTWGLEKAHSSGCSNMAFCSTQIRRAEAVNSQQGIARGWNGTASFLVMFDLNANIEDQDDDNDGILDELDACWVGEVGWSSNSDSDNDGDGCRDSNEDSDDDNDGWSDIKETYCGSNPLDSSSLPDDFDGDHYCDALDSDDDNDGWEDSQDVWPFDPSEWVDTDGDGIGNNADTDDDNDGYPDLWDQFPLDPTEDWDSDEDGIGDNADPDDDNDGWEDTQDDFPFDPTEWVDTDGNGYGDNTDLDDDGDGTYDQYDAFPLDPNESLDTDGDGQGDNADLDDDGDGYSDLLEEQCLTFPKISASIPLDTDSDGICNPMDEDDDGDGVEDWADAFPLDPFEWIDSDGDGVGNNADAFPNDSTENLDSDGDGVGNNADVFPNDSTENIDTDGDGIGDNSDPDDDNDGWGDSDEQRCETDSKRVNNRPADMDNDGYCDLLDLDIDGDGIDNTLEVNCNTDPTDRFNFPDDYDFDGICDYVDFDIDGDGFPNFIEIIFMENPMSSEEYPSFKSTPVIALFLALVGYVTYSNRVRIVNEYREYHRTNSPPRREMMGEKKAQLEWLVFRDRVWTLDRKSLEVFGKIWIPSAHVIAPDRRMIGVIDKDGTEYLIRYGMLWFRTRNGTWSPKGILRA